MKDKSFFHEVNKDSAVQDILDQLVGAIEKGVLKEGDALPSERSLAEVFGVSRPVVREAVYSLRILGVIRPVQGGANYITDDFDVCMTRPLTLLFRINRSSVTQVQQLRSSLEIECASLAAANCTPVEAAELNLLLAKMESEKTDQGRASLDRELHLKIASIANNPMIYQVLCASSILIENMITDIRALIMEKEKTTKEIDQEHRTMVEAIIAHEGLKASKCMMSHMATVTKYVNTMESSAIEMK